MILKLHEPGGSPLFVNTEHIIAFYPGVLSDDSSLPVTLIETTLHVVLDMPWCVTESVEEVYRALCG